MARVGFRGSGMPEWGVVEVLAGLDGGTPISRFFGDGTGDG